HVIINITISKTPLPWDKITLVITIIVSFLYALSLLIFREWMIAGLIIHSASLLIAGIVLFILLIK
ncbi:hypothetical protein Q4R36_17755, partial [Morganella morganii]